MPRSSSRSSSSGRSSGSRPMSTNARAPARAAPASHAPAPVAQSHAPAPMQAAPGGMASGMMGTMMSGLAFGTGSAIAHRAVGAVAGSLMGGSDEPASVESVERAAAEPVRNECNQYQQDLVKCFQSYQADISMCQSKMDNLNQCKLQFQ